MSDLTAPAISTLLPGQSLGNYDLLEIASAHRLATVFKARDRLLGRLVELNHLHPTAGQESSQVRQVVDRYASVYKPVAAECVHLQKFVETIADGGGVYTVTEILEGQTLREKFADLAQQALPLDTTLSLGLLAAAANGLRAMHARGLVHGCLTPDHLELTDDGGLKLTQAAIPALIDPQYVLQPEAVPYAAPEVLQGEAPSARSDLYSLGMIFYEGLAGRPGYESAFKALLRDERNASMRWVKWHANTKATVPSLRSFNPELPDALEQIITRLIDKTPTARLGSADQLLETIRRHFVDQPGPESTPTMPDPMGHNDLPDDRVAIPPAGVGVGSTAAAGSRPTPVAMPAVVAAPDTAPLPDLSLTALWIGGTVAVWILLGSLIGGLVLKQRKQERAAIASVVNGHIASVVTALNEDDPQAAIAAAEQATASAQGNGPLERSAGAWKTFAESAALERDGDFAAARLGYIDVLEQGGIQSPAWQAELAERIASSTTNAAFADGVRRISAAIDAEDHTGAQRMLDAWRPLTESELEDFRLTELQERIDRSVGEGSVESILARVNELLESDRTNEALATLERAINRGATDRRLLDRRREIANELGFANLIAEAEQAHQSERYTQAVTLYDGALAIQPDDEEARAARGRSFSRAKLLEAQRALENDNPDEAGSLLRQALQADPGNTEADRLLGRISDDSTRLTLIRQAQAAMDRRDWANAITLYDQARELSTDPVDFNSIDQRQRDARVQQWMDQAEAALSAGDADTAESAWEEARRLNANDSRVSRFGDLLEQQRNYDRYFTQGRDAFDQQEYGEATTYLLRAQDIRDSPEVAQLIDESRFQSRLSQARQYFAAGAYREADALLRTLRSERPTDQEILDLRDEVARHMGQNEEDE